MSDNGTWDENLQKWVSIRDGRTVYWDEKSQAWLPLDGKARYSSKESTRHIASLITLVVALAVGGFIWYAISRPSPDPTPAPTVNRQAVALQACRDDLKSQMEKPETLKFKKESPTVTYLDGHWRVAENITYDDSEGSWDNSYSCAVAVDASGVAGTPVALLSP